MYIEAQAPTVVVVTDADVPPLTPLGIAIRGRATGMMLRSRGKPLILCENETQEMGWWAEEWRRTSIDRSIEAQAMAEYMQDAVRRGVEERTIYGTIGGE